ncbi:MAG: EAL domain-containing protein [Kordiimonas sp.]
MAPVTQGLLLISYAILGVAMATVPPRLFGVDAQLFGFIGMMVFFGGWQLQTWLTSNRANADAKNRLEHLEDVTHILRKDLERARRELASRGREGQEVNEHLVSELKMLQTLLSQVSKKELEIKGEEVGAATELPAPTEAEALELGADHRPATVEETAPPVEKVEEEVLTEADIEELDLTPEEAAMVVMDEPEPEVEENAVDAPSRREVTAPARKAPQVGPAVGRKAPIRIIKRDDQLLSVVKSSLSENRVDLYLQPIVTLPSRKTAHFECFSRVRDEEGRIVLPRQYMSVAESKGLIGTIDNLLLFRLIQLVRRLGKRRPDLRFFCNMSRYSMNDEEFFPQFIDFMTSNEEFSKRLVFEISQEDYNALEEDVVDRLQTLARKGFGFSMDMVANFEQDFPALEKQGFQFVKTDLRDLLSSHPEQGDVEDFKSFLRRKGMQLIASRLESEDAVLQALEARVEYAQGYLFGEPSAATDLNREL